jgi:hypothetical protein
MKQPYHFLILILTSCFLSLNVWADFEAADDTFQSSLVSVSSTYLDIVQKQNRIISGVGIVLKTRINEVERFFVFTTSHLSQGNIRGSLRISKFLDQSKKITIVKSVFIDNDLDYEIIEIVNPQLSFYFIDDDLHCSYGSRCLQFRISDQLNPDLMSVTNRYALPIPMKEKLFTSKSPTAYLTDNLMAFFSIDSTYRLAYEKRESWQKEDLIIQNIFRKGLSGMPVLIQPAEVFSSEPNYKYFQLAGLIKGFHRYFNKSYILNEETLNAKWNEVRNSIESKEEKSNNIQNTFWKMAKCETYREYSYKKTAVKSYEILEGYVTTGGGEGAESGDSMQHCSQSEKLNSQQFTAGNGMIYKNNATLLFDEGDASYYANSRSMHFLENNLKPFKSINESEARSNLIVRVEKRLNQSKNVQNLINSNIKNGLDSYIVGLRELVSQSSSSFDSVASEEKWNNSLSFSEQLIQNQHFWKVKSCSVEVSNLNNYIKVTLVSNVKTRSAIIADRRATLLVIDKISLVLNPENFHLIKANLIQEVDGKQIDLGELTTVSDSEYFDSSSDGLNLKPLKLRYNKEKDFIIDLKGLIAMDLDQASTFSILSNEANEVKKKMSSLIQLGPFFKPSKDGKSFEFSASGQVFSKSSYVVVSNSDENYDWPIVCYPTQ